MTKNHIYLINREISWLQFNQRVLQEASDPNTPLIEKIKFLGIYSNNLDEFFSVRVATVNRMLNYDTSQDRLFDFDPKDILNRINKLESDFQKQFEANYKAILRELENERIYLVNETELSHSQGEYVKQYFDQNLRPHLFPIMMKNFNRTSVLRDVSIYLAIDLKSSSEHTKNTTALIQVPVGLFSRFHVLPEENGNHYIILIDDVIRYCLSDIFSVFGYDSYDAYTIKFTRDAEMDIDNDISKSFLEIMSQSLQQRKIGAPVRFVFDKAIPQDLLKSIMKKFKISEYDTVINRGRYHNFKDFMSFPNVGGKHLEYEPASPLPHPELPRNTSIIEIIRKKDIMLHYPYQSFQYIIDLLREASIDPKVRAIKMTLYRVAEQSNVMMALINAARNGKEVTVFIELQARFNEEANIAWSEKLQSEGVKIIQTIPGYKVHSKLILIRRKENTANIYYASIGTGNFHEDTAKVYADDNLLTANKDICADVNKVFHLFEEKFNPPNFKKLIVAPFHMRKFFIRMLNREMKYAREGKEAWVILKMNSLVDKKIIKKLLDANHAGVRILLIIRGICVLVPGIPGISQNIKAISIVDKYLEHSRIFVFGGDGHPKFYISSADWMVRNFDHRIEVACPIEDKGIQEELMTMLNIQLSDNTKARIISKENPNLYKRDDNETAVRAQVDIYKYFKNKLKQG